MLITVYGFSSILIPTFLLISGLSCFATIWTAQKTMRLITAILPFFTCVVTEKICRGALTGEAGVAGTSGAIKAGIAGVTGLMLIIIEILGAGVIAESVNRKIFYKGKEPPKPAEDDFDDSDDDSIVFVDETEADEDGEIEEDAASEDEIEEDTQFKYKKIGAKKTIFDKALDKLKQKKKDESFEALMEEAEELYESNIPSIDDYDNIDKKPSEAPVQEQAQTPVEAQTPAPAAEAPAPVETAPAETEDDAQPKNPASIISQEEYAALLSEDSPAESEVEELVWDNLPPAPAELPRDYMEDFDAEDPSLSFSPEELEEKSFAEEMKAPAPEETPATQNASSEKQASPYDSARYINSVVTNKSLPYAISLHDENEQSPAQQKKDDNDPYAAAQSINSKYPRKISLTGEEAKQEEEKEKALDPDFFDVDPNNLPVNEDLSDDIEPVPEEMEVDNTVFNQIAKQEKSINFSNVAENVFSDMEEDIRRDADAESDDDDGVTTDTNEEITDFTDFEKDENYDVSDDELFDVDGSFEEDTKATDEDSAAEESLDDDEETSPELNPNAGHANNLTADELTDFFNAQQEENTPQHKVIEGPAPKSRKATKKGPYIIPSDLLTAYKDDQYWIIDDETKQASINLKQTLAEFNIDADIIGIKKGPVVTMFEILPAPGVKLSKIVALQDNIALSLAAQSVRIVAPIPGKQAVGIEVPNKRRSVVGFREIIEMDLPEWNKMKVPVILGKDILGKAQLVDLVKTPHMLIAGATGSGKSVCVNSLILSILYKRSFKDVKMILVDPKVVELKLYNNIPHLLTPVITEPKKAIQALQYCLCEMERRYALLDGLGVRDISSYNERIKERNIATEKLPYIVVIIDEFADLMATSGKELENIVARLTAMSRAVGIHLVLATQRPSTNVITGLIKANIPSRIAFMVASRIDSQIIIDGVGAEKLLGRGDMLYASAVDPAPIRIQGTYLDDNEVEKVVECVKQYGEPDYIDDQIFVEDEEDEEGNVDLFGNNMDEDPLYDQALEIVVQSGKASASYIQRRLKIGYNRAARLVEEMEERGIVGPANGSKPREIIHIPG
jgi:S-DNA-T family DNA segregation ATPase FtsK/SpoIIIE